MRLRKEYEDSTAECQGLAEQLAALRHTQTLVHCGSERTGPCTARSDIDAVERKLQATEQTDVVVRHIVERKAQESAECELEVADCRLHWDILQAQVDELGRQLAVEIRKIHCEVGDMLKRASALSIGMYYFL